MEKQSEDLRITEGDRRLEERRQGMPDSVKPFLAWLIPDERRAEERRKYERRLNTG